MEHPMEQNELMRHLLDKIETVCRQNEMQAEKLAQLESEIKNQAHNQLLAMVRSMPRTTLRFAFAVTQHCDLNCAGCARFSPLAEPEYADVEETERDFKRLSELFGARNVSLIQLMGGEPLLHPELTRFFDIARREFPHAQISLVTNGLKLLAQPEEFWLSCKNNGIFVTPTKYPIPLDYEAIEAVARKYEVIYYYFDNQKEPVKTLTKFTKDPFSTVSGSNEFLVCGEANGCINLSHGRLYTCGWPPYVKHFNKYFGPLFVETPEDSIDIYQASSAQEILEFLSKPIPFCRYCRISKNDYNIPWHQSKKDINEWIRMPRDEARLKMEYLRQSNTELDISKEAEGGNFT